MASLEDAHLNEAALLKHLDDKGVKYERFTHPVVMTVEEQAKHLGDADGALAKNLLLKDKKGRLILVTALTGTTVDLKLLSQRLGMGKGGLRMAPLENLSAVLQVPEGSVTPLALFNKPARAVPLLLDQGFRSVKRLLVHPLVNDSTIALESNGLEEFLRSIGREAAYVDLEAVVTVGKDQPPDLAHLLQGSDGEAAVPSGTVAAEAQQAQVGLQNLQIDKNSKGASAPAASKGGLKPSAGPPGDDVGTCTERILSLLKDNPSESKAPGIGQTEDAVAPEQASEYLHLREELQHILVMFKNAAYTHGFVAAKSKAG